jgi:hypothetical protein
MRRMVLQEYDARYNHYFALGSIPFCNMLSMLKEANKEDSSGEDVPAHSKGDAGSQEDVPAHSKDMSGEEGRLPVRH